MRSKVWNDLVRIPVDSCQRPLAYCVKTEGLGFHSLGVVQLWECEGNSRSYHLFLCLFIIFNALLFLLLLVLKKQILPNHIDLLKSRGI